MCLSVCVCVHSSGHQYYIVLRIHSSTLIPVLEIYTALGGYRSEADGSSSPPTPQPSIVTCRFEWQPSEMVARRVKCVHFGGRSQCCQVYPCNSENGLCMLCQMYKYRRGNGRKMLIVGGPLLQSPRRDTARKRR